MAKGCLEENPFGATPDAKLEALMADPAGEWTGMRRQTLALRLGIEAEIFGDLAAAEDRLRSAMIEAALGTVPLGYEEEKGTYKAHGGTWFKSLAGGHELSCKVFELGFWEDMRPQLIPFYNAVRVAIILPAIEDLPT